MRKGRLLDEEGAGATQAPNGQIIRMIKAPDQPMRSTVCRQHGPSPATFYKLKVKYDESERSKVKKSMQHENADAELQRPLADAMRDSAVPKGRS